MSIFVHDGTFAGWLTAVFYVYEYRCMDPHILSRSQRQDSLFADTHIVDTEEEKAARVWKGLSQRLSRQALMQLYKTFLSEQQGVDDMLLQYAQYVFSSDSAIEKDYSHHAVLYVTDVAKKVHREKHRMEAFVRFRLTKDNIYYATVQPDFNVLPLIADHFEKRYADQQWMIYDVQRKYGLYYDLQQTQIVDMLFDGGDSTPSPTMLDDSELQYEHLWQDYFNSVNIKARKNMKLHIQHMPLRYWKFLTEKQLF